MKPGPANSALATPSRSAAARTSAATSLGFRPSSLASASAPLAWASAWSEGRTTGSTPGRPATASNGGCRRAASTTSGSLMGVHMMARPAVLPTARCAMPQTVASPVGCSDGVTGAARQFEVQRAVQLLPALDDMGVIDAHAGRAAGELDRHHAVVEPGPVIDLPLEVDIRRRRPSGPAGGWRRAGRRVSKIRLPSLATRWMSLRNGDIVSWWIAVSRRDRRRAAGQPRCSCSGRLRTTSTRWPAVRHPTTTRSSRLVKSWKEARNDGQCSRSRNWRSRSPNHFPGRPHAPSAIASSHPSRWWTPGIMRNGSVEASTRWLVRLIGSEHLPAHPGPLVGIDHAPVVRVEVAGAARVDGDEPHAVPDAAEVAVEAPPDRRRVEVGVPCHVVEVAGPLGVVVDAQHAGVDLVVVELLRTEVAEVLVHPVGRVGADDPVRPPRLLA